MKPKELREDLLAHLLEAGDEQERQRIELAVLEDDSFFDQLRATEAELVESYVQGDLEASTSLRLAELIGRSERLRESAETSLALGVRGEDPTDLGDRVIEESSSPTSPPSPDGPQGRAHGRSGRLVFLAFLLASLLLLGLFQVSDLRRELRDSAAEVESLRQAHESMTVEVELLRRELERRRQEHLLWQRRWAEEMGDRYPDGGSGEDGSP